MWRPNNFQSSPRLNFAAHVVARIPLLSGRVDKHSHQYLGAVDNNNNNNKKEDLRYKQLKCVFWAQP